MSVEHLAICLHHSRAKGTTKLVLLGIANHCGDGGAWPAIETLARYANVHERNVQKSLQTLVKLGELVIHDPTKQRRTNLYELRVSCPPSCDRTPQHRDTARRASRQTSLWITEGGASATPGVCATPTPGEFAGGPPAGAPPEPSSKPSSEPRLVEVSNQQTARERRELHPCIDCGAPPDHPWHAADDHPYRARQVSHGE